MSKLEQITAVAELLWIAKSCLSRIANTAWGSLGNQTKSIFARVDEEMSELMRLVDNAKDKCKEGGAE